MLTLASGCAPEEPIARDDFCMQWAQAVCNTVQHCCAGGAIVRDNTPACWIAAKASCEMRMPSGLAVDDGRLRYDANQAGTIVASIVHAGSQCAATPVFHAPYRSRAAPGDDCATKATDSSPATACEQGTVCVLDGTDHAVCKALSSLDATCATHDCGVGARCSNDSCLIRKADGAACDSAVECASGVCNLGTCAAIDSANECLPSFFD